MIPDTPITHKQPVVSYFMPTGHTLFLLYPSSLIFFLERARALCIIILRGRKQKYLQGGHAEQGLTEK